MSQIDRNVLARELASKLDYDPNTGILRWRVAVGTRQRIPPGTQTGCPNNEGYLSICYGGKHFKAHRIAWLIAMGRQPTHEIDHINGDRSDNRLANLREANRFQQVQNTRRYKTNTTGVKGVCWAPRRSRWYARISSAGRQHHLGYFKHLEEAASARRAAEARLHGEFASQR